MYEDAVSTLLIYYLSRDQHRAQIAAFSQSLSPFGLEKRKRLMR